jgi:hypothetical protein
MNLAERILARASYRELYLALKSITEEDIYVKDCNTPYTENLIYSLYLYEFIWATSDGRILLTPKGEKLHHFLLSAVEITKNYSKLNFEK